MRAQEIPRQRNSTMCMVWQCLCSRRENSQKTQPQQNHNPRPFGVSSWFTQFLFNQTSITSGHHFPWCTATAQREGTLCCITADVAWHSPYRMGACATAVGSLNQNFQFSVEIFTVFDFLQNVEIFHGKISHTHTNPTSSISVCEALNKQHKPKHNTKHRETLVLPALPILVSVSKGPIPFFYTSVIPSTSAP